MHQKPPGRFFIVGSSRSGTTLLQAMLASHPRVYSLPETHFFCDATPRSRRLRWLGMVEPARAGKALDRVITLTGAQAGAAPAPAGRRYSRYCRAFVGALDTAAARAGKDVWVEKTPHHIDYVEIIARRVPGAQFIHMLRDGRDVLASQYEAQQQDPQVWKQWPLEKMAETWNNDVQTSLACAGRKRHLVVSYEDLIESPEPELRRVAEFMGIEFDAQMLSHGGAAAQVIVAGWRDRPWMQNVSKPVSDTRLKKFKSVFSDTQRELVVRKLLWGGQVRDAIGRQPGAAALRVANKKEARMEVRAV